MFTLPGRHGGNEAAYVVVQVCQELERQAERAKLVAAHDGLDLEYLKNIMLKLFETGRLHGCLSWWFMTPACTHLQSQCSMST